MQVLYHCCRFQLWERGISWTLSDPCWNCLSMLKSSRLAAHAETICTGDVRQVWCALSDRSYRVMSCTWSDWGWYSLHTCLHLVWNRQIKVSNCTGYPVPKVPLVDWISDTCSWGYTDLQNLVKCLDHKCCGKDSMQSCKAVAGCAMHWNALKCISESTVPVK